MNKEGIIKNKLIILITLGLLVILSIISLLIFYPTDKRYLPEEMLNLTVGISNADHSALIILADKLGFFQKAGLNVLIKKYDSGSEAVSKLLFGESDIATAAEFVMVANRLSHPDLQILATIDVVKTMDLIANKNSGIQNINDLNNKKVGLKKNSQAEFFLGSLLIENGLTISDLDITNIDPPDMSPQLKSRKIDAVVVWEPYIYNIENDLGTGTVKLGGDLNREFYLSLFARQEIISNKTESLGRFLTALIKANDYLKKNPDVAKEIIRQEFDYSQAYLDYNWGNHNFSVSLDQSLIINMEGETRWLIANDQTKMTKVPNYLDNISLDLLEKIKPEAVTIIH